MRKNKESSIDWINAFYSEKHNLDSLIKGIDSLLNSHKRLKVSCFPVFIDPAFFATILNDNDQFDLISEGDGVYLFKFSFDYREMDERKRFSGRIFIVGNKDYDNVYTVVCLENPKFFSRGVLPYFTKQYPRANLTFITHKRLKNLLVDFREKNSFKDLTIVRTTTYSRVGKKIMPSVNWPEFSLEKAFEWVDDENGWFQNLAFRISRPHGGNVEAAISRKGIIKSNGYFRQLHDAFILPVSKTLSDNIRFFSKRARLDSPKLDIKPLCIDFGYDKFTDVSENKKFIESMDSMKAKSLSVMHGNPYVHLSLFDYIDGSSFDIWVLSPEKIIIVPQLKASFQSIKRLINHVFDNYAEGDIKEFVEA